MSQFHGNNGDIYLNRAVSEYKKSMTTDRDARGIFTGYTSQVLRLTNKILAG